MSKTKPGESQSPSDKERTVLYNSFMNAPAGIAILQGPTHIFEFANTEYEKLVGRNITMGKTLLENFPEIEQQGYLQLADNVFSTGEPFVADELPVELDLGRDGNLVKLFVNLVLQPLKDEAGKTERILAHVIDVTAQVEARKQIEDANQNLRIAATLIENIADAVVATDMDYKTTSWNKGAENLYGYASEEVMGKYAMELLDTQFLSDEDKQAWQTNLDTIGKWQGEVLQHKKDGSLVSVLVSISYVYDENGKPVGAVAVNRDITERKKAEEKILLNETKFRMLSETVPHMIWSAGPDGIRNFFNQYALDYTGKTMDELSGDGWLKLISPLDYERTSEQWYHSIRNGKDYKIENRWLRHDGSYHWYLAQGIAQKNEHGKILGWIGTNTEIEEQKKYAEELEKEVNERTEQLQLQNKNFEIAESIAQFGSYSWSMTTGALEYSDNLFRLLDCEPQEFVPSFEKFLSFIHPGDLQEVIKNGEQTRQTGALVETPYRIISKSGKTKWLRSSGSFSGEGANLVLIGTVQDISKDILAAEALVDKENYLNQIIINAPDAVIVIDENSIITLWNPKTEEIFGWKADEVLGMPLADYIVPEQYRQAHQEGMKRFLKTGEARILNKSLELTAINKEGKEFPISLTISQAMQQGKRLFIAFLRDITFEKRTIELAISNEALLKANTELEASQKLSEKLLEQRDEFISIASHEMKTPLTTAKGYTELLLLSLSEENQSALYATKANQALERLHDLVSELLDATKIQNGQLNYNITTFDFNKMMDETIENFQHGAKNHIIQKSGSCSQQITGDNIRLQQVLINLLSNAIKYSPHADKVTVKIVEQDNKIQVSVQDFGVGMSKHHLDKIFDRYYRVQEHATLFQGLGIGLYISHNIIQRHNGTMWAESEREKGSIFYFTLPL